MSALFVLLIITNLFRYGFYLFIRWRGKTISKVIIKTVKFPEFEGQNDRLIKYISGYLIFIAIITSLLIILFYI